MNEKKDTVYLRPKNKLVDSAIADVHGLFSFSFLQKGYYRISYKIKVDTANSYGERYNYQYDGRDHILVDHDAVPVELRPPVYCKYAKYRHMDECPVCHKKNKLLKVRYGLPEYDPDNINRIKSEPGEYMIGYCEIDPRCYARWYCSKCEMLF